MIKKTLSSQLRINMASGLLITIVSIGVTGISYPLYLHFLGYEKYGLWLILATVLAFARLGDLGISSAIMKIVAEEYTKGNIIEIKKYVSTAIYLLILSGSVIVFIILIFKSDIIDLFNLSGKNYHVVEWILPYIGFLSLYVFVVQVFNATISGLGRMDVANLIQIVGRVVLLAVSSLMLYEGYGIFSLLLGNICSCLTINLLSVVYIKKIIGSGFFYYKRFDFRIIRRILHIGGFIFSGSILSMIFDPFNKIILSRYVGISSIPVYDLAFRGTMQLRGIIESVFRAIMPEVSKLYSVAEEKKLDKIYDLNYRAFIVIIVSGLTLFIPLYFFSPFMLKLWLGKNFVNSLPFAFRVALLSVYISLVGVPIYYTFIGIGKVEKVFFSHLIQTVVNMFIVFVLVCWNPKLLVVNIYFSILAAQVCSTLFLIFSFRKKEAIMDFVLN